MDFKVNAMLISVRFSAKIIRKDFPCMALVLCTGLDPSVVRTRQLILERAGHVVVPALDEASLIQACQQNKFDVAVVGQTVSPKIKRRIAGLIRESCREAKLLELYTVSSGRVLDDADSWLEVLADVPQELAARVGALAAR
jgi:hypothetical protein